MQHGLAHAVHPAAPGPVPVGVVQHQHVCLERVGSCSLRRDLAQQTADRLEQHEAIAIGRREGIALKYLGNRRKPIAGEVGERELEGCTSHCFGRNPSSARTNASVASTWGQCPTGSSMSWASRICASSREPAIEMGSKVPWRIKV